MNKDIIYFSHDSNAHKDPKILKLRAKYGWEGYGLYWAIIETLREQKGYKWLTNDKELLSYSFANGEPLVNEIIDYCIEIGLLQDDGEYIYSQSLLSRMGVLEEKRKKRAEAGKKGAQKRWSDTDSKGNQKQSDGNANGNAIAKDGKDKLSKDKLSKEKELKTLRARYDSSQLEIIDRYFQTLSTTRKTGNLSPSIILNELKYWQKFDSEVVIHALEIHMSKSPDKKEEYTRGIIRRVDEEGIKPFAVPEKKKKKTVDELIQRHRWPLVGG